MKYKIYMNLEKISEVDDRAIAEAISTKLQSQYPGFVFKIIGIPAKIKKNKKKYASVNYKKEFHRIYEELQEKEQEIATLKSILKKIKNDMF